MLVNRCRENWNISRWPRGVETRRLRDSVNWFWRSSGRRGGKGVESHNHVTWRVPFLAGRRDAFRVERRQHRDALSFPQADDMAARPIPNAASDIRLQHGSGVRSTRPARPPIPSLGFSLRFTSRATLTRVTVDWPSCAQLSPGPVIYSRIDVFEDGI